MLFRLARTLTLAIACAFATLPVLAQPALTDLEIDMELARMAAPWLQAENPNGDIGEIAATVVCVIAALRELPVEARLLLLTADDFEDVLDLAVRVRPTLEDALKACF